MFSRQRGKKSSLFTSYLLFFPTQGLLNASYLSMTHLFLLEIALYMHSFTITCAITPT